MLRLSAPTEALDDQDGATAPIGDALVARAAAEEPEHCADVRWRRSMSNGSCAIRDEYHAPPAVPAGISADNGVRHRAGSNDEWLALRLALCASRHKRRGFAKEFGGAARI